MNNMNNMYRLLSTTICLISLLTACTKSHPTQKITPPPIIHQAHLQNWYPPDPEQLKQELDYYLTYAQKDFSLPALLHTSPVRAMIVPHAGYYYSGFCAATAYQALLDTSNCSCHPESCPELCRRVVSGSKNKTISRVIVLSPSHTMFLRGIALPDYTHYQTALGAIPLDTQALEDLKKNNNFQVVPQAHEPEHAIEVQLPFLQATIENFKLIPLVVGEFKESDYQDILKMLTKIITPETLIVVSSDFTHHGASYEYEMFKESIQANLQQLDGYALHTIGRQSYEQFNHMLNETGTTICGQNPIKLLLLLLESNALGDVQAHITSYYTSPQTQLIWGNDKKLHPQTLFTSIDDKRMSTSVSYAGVIFNQTQKNITSQEELFTQYEKKSLLHLARKTLENSFTPKDQHLPTHLLYPPLSPVLEMQAGAFVTLVKKSGELRGCIGQITSKSPLFQTVEAMARAAAFQDTRFNQVTKNELDNLVIDITVLSQPTKINSYKEIVLGKHGIVLNKQDAQGKIIASSVFLPQVPPAQRWDLITTLEQLSLKAGLDRHAWQECSFEVFEGFEIKE